MVLLSEHIIPIKFNEFGKKLWDLRENQRLMNAHPFLQFNQLTKLFPDRTMLALKHQARKLGLKKLPRWTEDEVKLLEKLSKDFKFDWDWLSSHFPNRTTEAVKCKYYDKTFRSEKRMRLHKGRNIK